MSDANAPAENRVAKDKMGKCPVCDLDCDTEKSLAEGLIDEKLISDFIEQGHSHVFVYGRETCGMTTGFMSQLDAENIAYELKNCDSDEGGAEMWAKLQAAGHTGSVGLPVVDMYGTTKVRPTVADVQAAAGGSSGGSSGGNPPPPACADSNGGCSQWKDAGYCTATYVAYMEANCKSSCGLCGGNDSSPPAPAAVDNGLVVYGRDTCGMTRQMKSQLEGAGIGYRFVNCDSQEGAQEMWPKLQEAGITGRIGLAVVDMWGEMAISPSLDTIKAKKAANER